MVEIMKGHECNGVGQKNPKDPSTYEFYEKIDVTNITSVEELPVFKCNGLIHLSWSKKFALFQKNLQVKVAEKYNL